MERSFYKVLCEINFQKFEGIIIKIVTLITRGENFVVI